MSNSYSQTRLLVFAKAPVPGQVKTRMQPTLTAKQSAELQEQLIEFTLEKFAANPLYPVDLWVDDIENEFIKSCGQRFNTSLHQQQGNDLGERMSHAIYNTLAKTASAAVVGCDCPALTAKHLHQLMQALFKTNNTVSLIPAHDGGYVALGMNTWAAELFKNIDWGSDIVLSQTRRIIQRLQLNYVEFEPLYDLDRPQDLKHLKQLPDSSRWEKFLCT